MSKPYGVHRPLPPADCGDEPAVYSRTISPSPTYSLLQQKTPRTEAAHTHAVHLFDARGDIRHRRRR